MAPPTLSGSTRELAHRVGAGITVTLLWDPAENSTTIELWRAATDETLRFEVSSERALDAFYHPLLHLQTEVAACASR